MVKKCIRCGGCCQTIPCIFAQALYHLHQSNKKCPALKLGLDGKYLCGLMQYKPNRSDIQSTFHKIARNEMLETGCYNPEFRRKK